MEMQMFLVIAGKESWLRLYKRYKVGSVGFFYSNRMLNVAKIVVQSSFWQSKRHSSGSSCGDLDCETHKKIAKLQLQ